MSGDGKILLTVVFEKESRRIIISQNATIAELNLQAAEAVFDGVLSTTDFHLTWGGELLLNGSETIKEINIPDKGELGYFLRLYGGPNNSLEPLPGYISTTSSEPCCITFDNDPEGKRAKMPCNCVISVESMIEFVNGKLETGNFRFFCSNCKGKQWQYFLVRHVLSAAKTEEELNDIDEAVNENVVKSPDMEQCPFCNSCCKRDMSRKFWNRNRVVCPLCSKRSGRDVEFCWCCLGSWRGNMESCGNGGCDGTDPRCRDLIDCPTTTIGKNVDVPRIRGCVKCAKLIYHNGGCKHMTCRCDYNFCFVCLNPFNKNKGIWECGGPYAKCPLAPRQKHLDEASGSSAASIPRSSSDDSSCIII